ncbi:MAG: S-ribosylhomocysteine lyase [Clostridia bacterium]|nr:S-ribosylhomocysteine lyase [Clostridia bacterium]
MDLIPSFQIDHTRLLPGIYVSRVDEVGGDFVTTFDLRMKRPNIDPTVEPAAMHTIEHLVATRLRNDPEWKDRIVYFGPMGCLTGCYLLVKGRPTPKELLAPVKAAYEFCADYEGEVPGATPAGCGNCRLHDLAGAKIEAKRYADLLKTAPCFVYPSAN